MLAVELGGKTLTTTNDKLLIHINGKPMEITGDAARVYVNGKRVDGGKMPVLNYIGMGIVLSGWCALIATGYDIQIMNWFVG